MSFVIWTFVHIIELTSLFYTLKSVILKELKKMKDVKYL